ncbi:MAG: hypothetical protein AB1782_14175 [Cyanobacteriota bacterium]
MHYNNKQSYTLRTEDLRGLLIDISRFNADKNLIILLKDLLYEKEFDYIYLYDTINESYEITHLEKLFPYLSLIKEHLNVFIYCRFHVPPETSFLDKTYQLGADAINLWCNTYKKNLSIIKYASSLWSNGTVLFDIDLNGDIGPIKEKIDQLTSTKILPILKNKNGLSPDILQETYTHLSNAILQNNINLSWILQFPITKDPFILDIIKEHFLNNNYISRKIALSYSNLRRKLMVKKVSESFDSASL